MFLKRRRRYVASGLVLALTVSGCGSDDPKTTSPENNVAVQPSMSLAQQATSTTIEAPVTTVTLLPANQGGPIVGTGEIDPGLQPFIETAAVDLAERLSMLVTDIVVESAVLTVWADTSLGCPDPKLMYAQVLTDGAAIALNAGGTTYWYHSGGTQGPFLCESPLRTTVE